MTPARGRSVGAFVRARRAGWERLAALVARVDGGGRLSLAEVEELDRLYRRAAGDLARARSAYPGSDAEGFLAEVLARAHVTLYRPPRRGLRGLARLYLGAVPRTFRAHPGALALAVGLLVAGAAGGALAVALDPGAAPALVPAEIRQAVAARRMWTDPLLSAAPGVLGSAIAHNNVTAAALAFALGLTGGVGTAALLVANGALLGAVTAHAIQGGMGQPALAFLATHGPVELSAFVIAAQAGFVLADGLLRPGERPRIRAVEAAGREGARLLALVVPALLGVALLETAVSPAAFPAAARIALGIGLGAGLWGVLLRSGRGEPEDAPPGGGAPSR